MSQDFEKIIDLLREMQRTNNANADSFDRLLEELSDKFDSVNSGASAELMGAYISELTKSVDDKYSVTLSKFQDIEQALKAVYNNQSDVVKNSDMKELFELFSKNVNNFYTEARQEKAILSGIEAKLSDLISNKSDKDDIIRTVSLLKNDFENINHAYKNTIDSVNTNLKSILSNLINMDPTKSGETAKAQIEIMYHSVNDIVLKLQSLEERGESLEKILANVATSKDLKITKGIIDSIIAKTYEIEQILKDVADKDDVDEIRQALDKLNSWADRTPTSDEFTQIRQKTDDLLTQTDEVKQSLSKVVQDIEKVPAGEDIEESMRKLYAQVEDLEQSIEASSVKDDMDIVEEKLETLKDELDVIKDIISDLNDAISSRVISAVEAISFDSDTQNLKDSISNMLNTLPQKEDIDAILQNNTNIFHTLLERTDDISDKLSSISEIEEDIENLSKGQKNISNQISNLNFEKEFSYIYDKTTSIESWLIDSNIKENSEKLVAQIQSKTSLADLDQVNQRTNQLIASLEELTKSKDIDNVSENLAIIDANILEVVSLLKNNPIHDDNIEILDKLSDIERSISEIVSRNEFNDFIEELKYCITKLSTNTGVCSENIGQMTDLRNEIEEKLNSFDFSQVLRVLNGKFDQLQTRLSDSITEEVLQNIQTGVSQALSSNEAFENVDKQVAEINSRINESEQSIIAIAEFIRSNLPLNEEFVKNQIDDIKSAIEARSKDVPPVPSITGDDIDLIKDYLDDIRNIVSQDQHDEVNYKLSAIEDSLSLNHTFYESAFSSMAEKLDNLKADISAVPENAKQLKQALSELASLNQTLSAIADEDIKPSKGKNSKISQSPELEKFLSEKFEDLKNSITELTSFDKEGKGFVYDSAVSEEKITAIVELLNDLKDNSDSDYKDEFLSIRDKLSDFKQELQLLSTDITQCLNSKMTELLSGLNSIREDAEKLRSAEKVSDNIESVCYDLMNDELSPQNALLIEKIHNNIAEKLQNSQNEIKDIVLSDTDSVIIKIDSLREYLEKAISALVPPKTDDLDEIKELKSEIIEFKDSFRQSLQETADSLMNYISSQNDEIKSLIAVANNHDDIIEAIEDLKIYVKEIETQVSETNENSADNVVSAVEYEEVRDQFKKISQKIEQLSDENASIARILDLISIKLEDVYAPKTQDFEELSDEDFISEEKPDFDFVQAFEMLQSDISNLKTTITGIQSIYEKNEERSEIPSLNEDSISDIVTNKVEDLLNSLSKTWLDDLKNFIVHSDDEIISKLDVINSKLDVMVSDTSNSDMLEEISETVYGVDEKLSQMLEDLNKMVADISSGSTDDIEDIKNLIKEQQTYVQNLEPSEKLDAFKKCLDELTEEVSSLATDSGNDSESIRKSVKEMKDSLMTAVVNIFDQVSFVEESEDIKDFVEERTDEINKNIEQITKQLKQISSTTPNDYNYSLQDVETDLAKLRLALNELKVDQSDVRTDDMAQITDKLHSISTLVDSLTQDEMKTLKSDISALKEQTQFLIATSDKSYNALNSGIVGFEEIINDSLTGKVDKVTKMLEQSADADNVIKQALIYMGEWIDSASENINKISANSEEIAKINENLKILKSSINTEVTQSLENKFDLWNLNLQKLERQFARVENLEEQMSHQQDRIDRLEMNIDKLVSMMENMDDSASYRKIDKIEKQLSKLGSSIEKLTSYVE